MATTTKNGALARPAGRGEVQLGEGLTIRLMEVEPRAAEEWLTRNREENRAVRRSRVKRYARDMAAGRWAVNDQPVSFDSEGRLVNGQHRLLACLEANASFRTLVLHGLPAESMLALDGAAARSTDDNFKVAGVSAPRGAGATVRRLFAGHERHFSSTSYPDALIAEFLEAHGPAVRFAHKVLPKGRHSRAPVRAVVVRAAIRRAPPETLEAFARVLESGLMGKGEGAAVLLRNHLLASEGASGFARGKAYALAERALACFLAGETPKKLLPADEELFPIPGEGSWNQ